MGVPMCKEISYLNQKTYLTVIFAITSQSDVIVCSYEDLMLIREL